MSESNFTRGPRHTNKRFMDKQKTWMRISIQSNEPPPHRLIAEMPDPTYCNPKDCAESAVINANAALIAAAPEMYELLQRLSHALFAEDADEWTAEIKSLLAKANGVDDE